MEFAGIVCECAHDDACSGCRVSMNAVSVHLSESMMSVRVWVLCMRVRHAGVLRDA